MQLKQHILEILKRSDFGSLGTVNSDGKPWIRYMGFSVSDDLTIHTPTYLNTRKVKEIKQNPEVHLLCGFAVTDASESSNYCQIQGIAKIITDAVEKKKLWLPHFASYFTQGPDDPNFGMITITPYRIELVGSTKVEVWEATQ